MSEKDDLALARMNAFFYRSTHDGEFNILMRRLERAPKEIIKSINKLLEFSPSTTTTTTTTKQDKEGLLLGKKKKNFAP